MAVTRSGLSERWEHGVREAPIQEASSCDATPRRPRLIRLSGPSSRHLSSRHRVRERARPRAARRDGTTETIGAENIYTGDERLGAALRRAHADALAWIETQRRAR